MSPRAPFRFLRVARWVHSPAWAHLATHDIPFSDGLSGFAEITLTAITPLLVGGTRRAATPARHGEVWPFRAGDQYAIPPSQMQGLSRAILEIGGFGRLGERIDDRRFGIRDLSAAETGRVHYQRRLSTPNDNCIIPNSKAGLLRRVGEVGAEIIPCELARIHVNDVFALRNAKLAAKSLPAEATNPFHARSGPDDRYRDFLKGLGGNAALTSDFVIDPPTWHPHQGGKIQVFYSRCKPGKGHGAKTGSLVFTGKNQAGTGAGAKKWEFVFHDPDASRVMPVPTLAWQAFRFLHDDQPGRPINPGWNKWRSEFEGGNPVPVFYWLDATGAVDTLGMAFAFKAAHTGSTHDLLAHSSPDHVTPLETAPLDFANLIFGVAAEGNKGRGLKRRAWFGMGRSTSQQPTVDLHRNAVLLGPKPNYYPFYVRQKAGTQVGKTEPMATYSAVHNAVKHLSEPELAGVKIWPASHAQPFVPDLPELPPTVANNNKVQTRLNPVPIRTRFTIPLTFHNLRPMELGALLWTLSFGDEAAFGDDPNAVRLHHRLGMGKPFGLGEVAIHVALSVDDDSRSASDFLQAFTDHMNAVYPQKDQWANSRQVKALLKAANPAQNPSGELRYMDLRPGDGTYVGERDAGRFPPEYVHGGELARPAAPPPAAEAVPASSGSGSGGDGGSTSMPLVPQIRATVRFMDNANKRFAGKEGVIEKVIGSGPYCDYLVRVTGSGVEKVKASLFTVIAAAPA